MLFTDERPCYRNHLRSFICEYFHVRILRKKYLSPNKKQICKNHKKQILTLRTLTFLWHGLNPKVN